MFDSLSSLLPLSFDLSLPQSTSYIFLSLLCVGGKERDRERWQMCIFLSILRIISIGRNVWVLLRSKINKMALA
jgi:hypothetical protein